MDYILKKYKKYGIEYDLFNCVIKINKKIPVETFGNLKKDLLKDKIYVSNIIVEGR